MPRANTVVFGGIIYQVDNYGMPICELLPEEFQIHNERVLNYRKIDKEVHGKHGDNNKCHFVGISTSGGPIVYDYLEDAIIIVDSFTLCADQDRDDWYE